MFINGLKEFREVDIKKGDLYMREVEGTQISRDTEISIEYRFLEARKSSNILPKGLVKYPISIYLGEAVGSSSESIFLPFIAAFESRPDIVSFAVKGEIFVKGSPQTVKHLVLSEDGRPPRIWSRVYQDVLSTVSDLAKCLDVSLPTELRLKG